MVCRDLFSVCVSVPLVNEIKSLQADITYIGKHDEIWHTDRSGLAVHLFQDWQTLAQGVPWYAKIHKWVKSFCSTFLVHRLAERDEIWHDDRHWSVPGLKQFW